MLVVKNLSKSFASIRAVDNLNFCLHKGVTVLLGPNGAGKTTLMRLLCGYYVADCGTIEVNQISMAHNREEALSKLSYVPENGALYPEMTVYQYLKYISCLHGLSSQQFVDNLVSTAKQLGLDSVITQRCETLSKGYRRRVALAGALLSRPQILILDEPTEGLDPNQKFYLREFIRDYGRRNVVLISTHIMEEVEAVADRVILLNHGKLIRDTSPSDLKKMAPDNDMEAAFRAITFFGGAD